MTNAEGLYKQLFLLLKKNLQKFKRILSSDQLLQYGQDYHSGK